jgi:hypothetical protein
MTPEKYIQSYRLIKRKKKSGTTFKQLRETFKKFTLAEKDFILRTLHN